MVTDMEIPANRDGQEAIARPRRYVIERHDDKLTRDMERVRKGKLTVGQEYSFIIENWGNPVEKYALSGCGPILGLSATAMGCYLNRHFRNQLYLQRTGRISSYIIVSMFPAIAACGLHLWRVSDNIYNNFETCTVCTQIRGGITQLITGVGYPLLLAPVVSFPLATRFKSYSLPKLSLKTPFNIVHYAKEIYKPILPTIKYIAIAQVIFAMGITYFQQSMYYGKILPEIKIAMTSGDDARFETDNTHFNR